MARTPTVWHRKQDGFYYTTIRGKKHKLSKDRKDAQKLFHALMAKEEDDGPKGTAVAPTFRKVADLFLDESERTKKPNTYRMHKYLLQSFCDHVGKRRVRDLKVHHVTEWVGSQDWNESTACSGRSTLLACLNWAVAQGYIDSHPLGKLKRGAHRKRDRVLTPEERQKIREFVKPDFADFLFALEQTGARPFSEMAQVTADMVNWEEKTIAFKEHKTAGRGKTRTVYLTPSLIEVLRRLSDRYPTGHLFRNCRGNPWTSHDATRRLHYATDKLGLERASLYAYRHTFLTDALSKGMSADVLAELAGNSAITIARNYSHLAKKRSAMLEAAEKAVS